MSTYNPSTDNNESDDTIDLDAVITINCKVPGHGAFTMRAGDHIGENDEKIAYGCPKCGHQVMIQ